MSQKEEPFVTRSACQTTTSQLLSSQGKLHVKLDNIEKRLFKDNGSVSIQTRLDRHDQILKMLLWGIGIIAASILAANASGVVLLMRETIARRVA